MVYRQTAWWILSKFECSTKLIDLIAEFHSNNMVKVRAGKSVTEKFKVANGVRQGCVIAPLLFNASVTAFIISVDHRL